MAPRINALITVLAVTLTVNAQSIVAKPTSSSEDINIRIPKTDCHPLPGATEDRCKALGCTWKPVETKNGTEQLKLDDSDFSNPNLYQGYVHEPWCYMPDDRVAYEVENEQPGELTLRLVRNSALPNDIKRVKVTVQQVGDMAIRVRIVDADKQRFEPELPELNLEHFKTQRADSGNGKLIVKLTGSEQFNGLVQDTIDPVRIVVQRSDTGAKLFDSDLRKLIFADQFIQLNTNLDSKYVFGLGEHFDRFTKKADRYQVYSHFTTDQYELSGGARSYAYIPFYVSLDSNNTKAHAVFLRNSNALDTVLQADQSISFRPIGGVLDFIIFGGPTPYEAVAQFQKTVGLPQLPPRWTLGFHLCRWGYNSTEGTERVMQRTRDAGIPLDVQWNDIDYMDKHDDFTYDKKNFAGLPDLVKKIHDANMKYMILFDPGVAQEDNYEPYSLGIEMDIFIKNASDKVLVNEVWNDVGRTVFPDFSNPVATDYWTTMFKKFHNELEYDGAWIDMNDISGFLDGSVDSCPKDSPLENPPYSPGNYPLHQKTLCMTAKHKAGLEYNVHNLYSFYETIATNKALKAVKPNKRPFILSRSTFAGQGKYGGHWSGDVLSTWPYLRWSIPSLLEYSMYGYSLIGSDICGFNGDTNKELCARWSTLGAFYSFSRNHNDIHTIEQDPVALGQEVVDANKNALTVRYMLLPYLYTLLHNAHRKAEPFARSLALDYFSEPTALEIEDQFMVGKAVMVAPIVHENTSERSVKLPPGKWYQMSIVPEDKKYSSPQIVGKDGEWSELNVKDIGLAELPIFVKGGHVIPVYRNPKPTTAEIVRQPLSLQVFLCSMHRAHGEVYLDDGETDDDESYDHLTFVVVNQTVSVTMDVGNYKGVTPIGLIRILGLPESVQVEGVSDHSANKEPLRFEQDGHMLYVSLDRNVTSARPLVISWQYTT